MRWMTADEHEDIHAAGRFGFGNRAPALPPSGRRPVVMKPSDVRLDLALAHIEAGGDLLVFPGHKLEVEALFREMTSQCLIERPESGDGFRLTPAGRARHHQGRRNRNP